MFRPPQRSIPQARNVPHREYGAILLLRLERVRLSQRGLRIRDCQIKSLDQGNVLVPLHRLEILQEHSNSVQLIEQQRTSEALMRLSSPRFTDASRMIGMEATTARTSVLNGASFTIVSRSTLLPCIFDCRAHRVAVTDGVTPRSRRYSS